MDRFGWNCLIVWLDTENYCADIMKTEAKYPRIYSIFINQITEGDEDHGKIGW